MIRVTALVFTFLGVAGIGCTLLLPTNEIIQPCTNNEECEDGFICDQNACLPEDSADGASG